MAVLQKMNKFIAPIIVPVIMLSAIAGCKDRVPSEFRGKLIENLKACSDEADSLTMEIKKGNASRDIEGKLKSKIANAREYLKKADSTVYENATAPQIRASIRNAKNELEGVKENLNSIKKLDSNKKEESDAVKGIVL